MNKKEPYEENVLTNCDVCRQPILVDQYGNGQCKRCGWEQSEDCKEQHDKVLYPNRVSFDKAKRLYELGKEIKPDFDDFIGMFKCYAEVEFEYRGAVYGVSWLDKEVYFFRCEPDTTLGLYKTVDEFAHKASINGVLLRDIWDKVRNADWLQ